MKGFRKLSSIALLLFAFVSVPSLAQAKDISVSNALNEQGVTPEVNLVGEQTGELLISQRRSGRYRIIRRRQQPLGGYRIIQQRRQPFGRNQIIRQRRPFGRNQIIRQRQPFGRNQIIRQQQLRRQREFRRQQQYRRQWY